MRVLFTSVPGIGHIHPMLPLAQAFVARGDDVLWLTGADGCERIEQAGVPARAAGLGDAEGMAEFHRRFPETAGIAPQDVPDFMFPRLFGTVRAPRLLDDAAPVVREWAPDLVVSDAAELAGPILARMLGVPNATYSFGALLPPHRVAAAAEEVSGLWRRHGLEPRPYCGCYDHMYLDIYPPSLQRADASHVGRRQLIQPAGGATQGEDAPEWLGADGDVPLLYVTLGTVFSSHAVLASVLLGLADSGVRVIVTVGPRGDPAALGPQPANVHVARYIAQQHVLPHASAVVSHAGSGTFLASLAAGLPQVCLPQGADQFLNAAAASASGCAVVLQPGEVDPARVSAAVDDLLANPAYRRAAEAIGEEIASMPTAASVADTLAAAFG